MRCIEPQSAVFHSITGHQGQIYTKWRAYIYIYIYMLWSYYLGQVWPFNSYYLGQVRGIIWAKVIFDLYLLWFQAIFSVQLSFCVFLLCPIICQLSKNNLFFQKKGAKFGFPKFLCFKFNFVKISFLVLLKHYQMMCFSQIVFFFVEREKHRQTKMIIVISGFGFWSIQKWPFRDAHLFFLMLCWNPIFIVFFGCAFFAKLSKREILDTHQKGKKWLITEKLVFLICLCVLFLEGLGVRWGGPNGHLTWP